MRLAGTEKQRDDALEALVMQQEIAEELERERKRNKKHLSALQETNETILRQRDEAQRVVIHLRALIDGQAHHMEHIVRSLSDAPEVQGYIEEGYPSEDDIDKGQATVRPTPLASRRSSRASSRAASRASTVDARGLDVEDVNPDMERRFFSSPLSMKRFSQGSVADVADRHLRDKTDAIADIIRNISEQCAAAVKGLHLAQVAAHEHPNSDSEQEEEEEEDRESTSGTHEREIHDDASLLSPNDALSSIPPTPDLVHHRSSTAMSMASTQSPERLSIQYQDLDVPTKIAEADDTGLSGDDGMSQHISLEGDQKETAIKNTEGIINRAGARVSAFGTA